MAISRHRAPSRRRRALGRLALLTACAALVPACRRSRAKDVTRCGQALIRIQNGLRAKAILDRELADHPALLAALRMEFQPMYVASMPRVDLPKPADSAGDVEMVLQVSLRASGEVYVDGKKADLDRVEALARAARAENPEVRAVIRADSAVRHGRIIHVLDLLKQAGITKIAFAITPSDAGATPRGGTTGADAR